MAMDIYKTLGLRPVRKEPGVWVRRVVIFKEISPAPVVIRDIPLSKGLNVIWAEESESEADVADITGHSAGKTTFCRLLRYLLGEKTYGTKASTEAIERAFPGGYVAAELIIRGRLWAVLRPIGTNRNSYVKPDAVVEDVLTYRMQPAYLDDYPGKLGLDGFVHDLATHTVVRTDQEIEWGHVLAWCTRDQEARFQSIHEWRSPRSESGWSSFAFLKADPLFVMRTILGLFDQGELLGEENLAKLYKKQDAFQKAFERQQMEPQFRVNLYDRELRTRLKASLPEGQKLESLPLRSGDLTPDLEKMVATAAQNERDQIAAMEDELRKCQDRIDDLSGEIRRQESDLATLRSMFALGDGSLSEIAQGLAVRQEDRKLLESHGDKSCPFGKVLFRECEHVQRRQGVLLMSALRDAHELEQMEAKRADEQAKLGQQEREYLEEINRLKANREGLKTTRDAYIAGIREKKATVSALERALHDALEWTEKRDTPGGYKELDEARKSLSDIAADITKQEKELAGLLLAHDISRDRLAKIFSGAAKAVLPSGAYDGRVSLAGRELTFSITHGPAMSGEAVDTLAVLLADLACLIYTTVCDKSALPCLLLHDSPREADLGLRLYQRFILFVASLQQHFGNPDSCPFQYIITTTTPPPKEIQTPAYIKLKLDAGHPDGLLLKRNLADEQDAGPALTPTP